MPCVDGKRLWGLRAPHARVKGHAPRRLAACRMVERRQLAERQRVAGNAAMSAGQWSEALRCYETGLDAERHSMALHANAALAALKLGCHVQAMEHCDKARIRIEREWPYCDCSSYLGHRHAKLVHLDDLHLVLVSKSRVAALAGTPIRDSSAAAEHPPSKPSRPGRCCTSRARCTARPPTRSASRRCSAARPRCGASTSRGARWRTWSARWR